MKSVSIAVPSLTEVAAALRKITEVLAHELASPTTKPPQWTEFEWRVARAVAAMHGISSLLYRRLRWKGPESWRRFLQEQQDQSIGRHLQITNLLDSIDSQSRCDGVAFMALKGAALHACGLYAAGERPMGDIDLLVRHDDVNATARVLESCGYEAAFTSRRHQVFKPRMKKILAPGVFGEHVDNPIKIEVHTRIAEHLPVTAVDITQILSVHVLHAGLNRYPSMASLMMHLLLHAAGNIRARALRLIQLHDIALLASRLDAEDWEALLATRLDERSLWWALAPLMLTAHYYPGAIPSTVFSRLDVECPWLLARCARRQRLGDVSWSNIRIAAFPGVEWSQTMGEALAFMRSRIWPSREVRLELKIGTAEIPGVTTVPWYGISQGSRILRWVFSRPPRVQTLLSVKAALAQEN
jgi:Uncharacterised nucleotidyltransferase